MGEISREAKPSMNVRGKDERSEYVNRLRGSLAVCPTDILARCQLAVLLEELGEHNEALFNWRMALACDPNSLIAREGFARCRRGASR